MRKTPSDSALPNAGYGQPPLSSRWKRGQSGNPKGRTPKIKEPPANKAPVSQPPDYKVGFRSPPLHTQFKAGSSGNPRGRTQTQILQDVLLAPFPVKIGGRTEMVPALDAMLLRVRARALEGDQQAIRSLLELFDSSKLTQRMIKASRKKPK